MTEHELRILCSDLKAQNWNLRFEARLYMILALAGGLGCLWLVAWR